MASATEWFRCRLRLSLLNLIILALLPLLPVGCAKPPWGNIIEGDPAIEIEQAYEQIISSQQDCPPSWDAEIMVNWSSALSEQSFSGYIQVLLPAYFKLIVSNPLGQPLSVIAVTESRYHYLDAVNKASTIGNLRSFVVRNDLSLALLEDPWMDWLGGRIGGTGRTISQIRADMEARGVWLTIAEDHDNGRIFEHLLINQQKQRITERVIVDEQAVPVLTVTYGEWLDFAGCLQPMQVAITGLAYGTHGELRFSEPARAELTPAQFTLPIPPGYSRTLLP